MRDALVTRLVDAAESGLPDRVVRLGMRAAIAGKLRSERQLGDDHRRNLLDAWHAGPVALVPEAANLQHYEVPAGFFQLVLGPRLKYSACLWQSGADLAGAEEGMLDLTCRRAGLEDGMAVLDLGSGWGSLSLWIAERYPGCRIVAVSNSASQQAFVQTRAESLGLANLEVGVADVNAFDAGARFDRVMSVEMMEHVRNHPELFSRIHRWVQPGGAVFVHVFSHRDLFWPYEDTGPGDWMARSFFSGGIMPSHRVLPEAAAPWFELDDAWIVDGTHYRRTLDAWLRRFDARAGEVRAVLAGAGPDPDRWMQRWRMFLMACSELFGFAGGSEWGVSHYLFRPRSGGSRAE
ncbi:MAG: cyclopropane-fatty-acyl-phospholipid synthase family protein [Acidimicrobiia bacterium]